MRVRFFFAAVCVFMVSTQSGCIVLAPFVESFKSAGATPADRRMLFGKQIKKFGDALYWGKGEAGAFVSKEAGEAVRRELTAVREDMRIVDTSVTNMDFDDGAYEANVQLTVKFYRIPVYVVTEQRETQLWKFSFADGWKLTSREIKKS